MLNLLLVLFHALLQFIFNGHYSPFLIFLIFLRLRNLHKALKNYFSQILIKYIFLMYRAGFTLMLRCQRKKYGNSRNFKSSCNILFSEISVWKSNHSLAKQNIWLFFFCINFSLTPFQKVLALSNKESCTADNSTL